MLMIIIAINTTKILEELTIIATKNTSYNPGDWVELLFVGARRLSGVGGGRQADDQRGRWGGSINVDAYLIEANISHQTDGIYKFDFILYGGMIYGAFLCSGG